MVRKTFAATGGAAGVEVGPVVAGAARSGPDEPARSTTTTAAIASTAPRRTHTNGRHEGRDAAGSDVAVRGTGRLRSGRQRRRPLRPGSPPLPEMMLRARPESGIPAAER